MTAPTITTTQALSQERGTIMGRKNRTTVKTRRRAQRSKHIDPDQVTELFATYLLLCGCWSNAPTHTCGQAPPRYCGCGATTNEGCSCPSTIGRVA